MMGRLKDKKRKYLLLPLLLILVMFFLQPVGEAAATRTTPGFAIGGIPFHFMGGFLPGWHWGLEYWSEAADDDLITSARNTGMTVIHIMLPLFESPLGVYDEAKLQKLDHFLNSAYNARVYVMPSFIQAYSETLVPGNTEYPYYHPRSIEGIIKDPGLRQAFRNRIAALVNRQNTYNGRYYKDDPTIMAWIVCDEPISGPFNYPNGLPQITLAELTDWFQETASYIKSIDPSHLVTVWAQPAIQEFFGWTLDYLQALGIPEFDFMYTEDADLTIVPGLPLGYNCSDQTPQYMLDQFLPGKPVVFHPAFTSGCWDTNIICDSDFTVQSTHLNLAIPEYFAVGGNAVLIQNWGTDLYSSVPGWAQCRTYTDSYPKIVAVARTHSALVNPDGHPLAPLGFVRVIYGLNAAKSGSGSGTITSNPTGISCGSDCSEAFSQGSLITLTAQADADSIFTSWSGGGCSGTGTCSVTMNADITVTATFILANVPPEISPKEGTIGTELTIGGSGFGTKKGKLLINGIAAKIAKDGWAPNQIISTISTIPLPVDVAHPVSVVVNKVSILLDGTFTVRMPVLDELLVSTGIPGIPITVTGKFFGTKKGKVYLEDPASGKKKRCKVTYWYMNPANGNSTLTFEVPKLPKGLSTGVAYPLKVANKVGTVQTTFTVKPTPP
jgi:hypothetical protein